MKVTEPEVLVSAIHGAPIHNVWFGSHLVGVLRKDMNPSGDRPIWRVLWVRRHDGWVRGAAMVEQSVGVREPNGIAWACVREGHQTTDGRHVPLEERGEAA